jgi:tetratricopeptide (TPR) repeat protein
MAFRAWQQGIGELRGPSLLGNAALVLVVIGALFAADTFLTKAVRADSKVEAARLFREGRSLIDRGDDAAAINRIEDALAIDRDNRDYARTLAQAQLAAGKFSDAESNLTDLLQADPSDGPGSLIMARVLVREGRYADAISYFHRAIYGHWSDDPSGNRLKARFELIDVLAQQNSKEELLAELLTVQDQAPADLAARIRIGRLFLAAGSPARAADVFRGVLRDSPGYAAALAGLGDAAFASGNYRTAQKDFSAAVHAAPDDRNAHARLDLTNQVLALDPSIRGISGEERFQRSRELLELAAGESAACIDPAPSPRSQQLLEEARRMLKERVRSSRQDEAAEANLDLAEQLWQTRKAACKAQAGANTPLALVMTKLAQ